MSEFPSIVTIAILDGRFFKLPRNGTDLGGVEGKLLDLLSQVLRFGYKLVSPIDGQWGRLSDDGNWTGIIGMVARGEADLAISYLSITEGRKRVVDYSEPYAYSELGFATNPPAMKSRVYTYVYPFDLATWACIFTVLLVMPFTIIATNKVKLFITDLLLIVCGNLLRQDLLRNKMKGNLAIGCWWLVASILSMGYTAVLSSFLTVPLYETPVRNFKELAKAVRLGEYAVLYRWGSSQFHTLYESGEDHLILIAEAMGKDNFSVGIVETIDDRKVSGKKLAILDPKMSLDYDYGKYPFSTKFVSSDDGVTEIKAMPVNKKFCCKPALDRTIYRVKCAGIFEKLSEDEFFKQWIRSENIKWNDPPLMQLSFSDISGAFIVLACGYLIATLCLFLEKIIK